MSRSLSHMPREYKQSRRSVLLTFRFLRTTFAGTLVTGLVFALGPLPAEGCRPIDQIREVIAACSAPDP
jgi:hypothetical protein